MKNSVTARIEFSFKGEDYDYASCIDLDQLLARHDALPSVHAILAREHGIDSYSYLYEVMQETEIEYSSPSGSARDYLVDGEFCMESLAENWQSAKAIAQLQPIAALELGIEDLDLDQHQQIRRALLAAYFLGKRA